jgi:hypothetical protein
MMKYVQAAFFEVPDEENEEVDGGSEEVDGGSEEVDGGSEELDGGSEEVDESSEGNEEGSEDVEDCNAEDKDEDQEASVEDGDSADSVQLSEPFWHEKRIAANERNLAAITGYLNDGLARDEDDPTARIFDLKPTSQCNKLITRALHLLRRDDEENTLKRIFTAAISCFWPWRGALSLVFDSNVMHQGDRQLAHLEEDALAVLNLNSLTDPRLPEFEQERGWVMRGEWVSFARS